MTSEPFHIIHIFMDQKKQQQQMKTEKRSASMDKKKKKKAQMVLTCLSGDFPLIKLKIQTNVNSSE